MEDILNRLAKEFVKSIIESSDTCLLAKYYTLQTGRHVVTFCKLIIIRTVLFNWQSVLTVNRAFDAETSLFISLVAQISRIATSQRLLLLQLLLQTGSWAANERESPRVITLLLRDNNPKYHERRWTLDKYFSPRSPAFFYRIPFYARSDLVSAGRLNSSRLRRYAFI